MNTKAITSAAGVINAALTQNRTAAGIALALDAAGLLMTTETAAELARLRARFAVSDHPVDEDPIAYALTDKVAEACDHPNGYGPDGYGPDGCAGCGEFAPTRYEDDVRPQVRKLRALLAGQRAQVGPQVDVTETEAGKKLTFTPRGDAS
ncbi:MAG: hypothetical protein HOV73_18315 [Streptomyces sp.]|nr:hypothetical protein [Streptomyces sp.]NUS25605.1 hypothetical protein [Streptomyces sp.]NUS76587.1 hypothetical protein [Streptomyces sp.]